MPKRVLGATAIVGLGIGVGTFAAAPLAAYVGIAGTTGAGMFTGLLIGATIGTGCVVRLVPIEPSPY